ncbi:MAG TPA: hypothetical protein VEY51_17575 [Chondromyces sp.]|nr:hypothetical protein [Chondromyces sp.]
MGKRKFFIAVAMGAFAGGVVSMLDKNTRGEMKEWGKYLLDLAQDPDRLQSSSKELMDRAKQTAQQISEDVAYIKNKVDDLKGRTPDVKELVEETKETFLPEGETKGEVNDYSVKH